MLITQPFTRTLTDVLESGGLREGRDVIYLALHIAKGMKAIHSAEIHHGSLCSDNILVRFAQR